MKYMKRTPPSQNRFILSSEDLKKYDYISTFEDVLLFNRLANLLSKSIFTYHIRQYLMDYYLLGYSDIIISSRESDLLELLNEYFEFYLFHEKEEFCSFILAELLYNSEYNDLIDEQYNYFIKKSP